MDFRHAAPRVREMMDNAAQQYAVQRFIGKRQLLDIAFKKFEAGIFQLSDGDQLRAYVDTDRLKACLLQKIGKYAGPAAKIGDPSAGFKTGQSLKRIDQKCIG